MKNGWVINDTDTGEEVFVDSIGCNARGLSCDDENNLIKLTVSSMNPTGRGILTEKIGDLTTLKTLSLVSARLKVLPESIGNLSQLKDLNLAYNDFVILPESLGNLAQLESLGFYGCKRIIRLPESIGGLTKLQNIKFSQAKFTTVPASFGNLHQLTEADFSYVPIRTLPENFKNLTNLNILSFWNSGMTSLPHVVTQLPALEHLNLGYARLTILPENIGNLSTLKQLQLYGNRLDSLPDSISQLSQLEELNLNYNRFIIFPSIVLGMPQLKQLYLGGNNFYGQVPAGLLGLTNLNDYNTNKPSKKGLRLDYNAMTNDDATLATFMAQKTGNNTFHDGQVFAVDEASFIQYQRENNLATVTIRWSKPEYAGSNGLSNSFRIQVKDLRMEDSDFVDFIWVEEKTDQDISWRAGSSFTDRWVTVKTLAYEDGFYQSQFTINTGAEDYAFTIEAAHQYFGGYPSGYTPTLGKASPLLLMNDVDGDGALNAEDAFIQNAAAAQDSDADGMPDGFIDGCDDDCQQASGLTLDPYPTDASNTPPKATNNSSGGGSFGWGLWLLMGGVLLSRKRYSLIHPTCRKILAKWKYNIAAKLSSSR